MSLFPMTETIYWTIGFAFILISGSIGLFVGKIKTHNGTKGFISGLQYGYLFWAILYLIVGLHLK